ncbi:MAG: nickel/cobalt transporter, partial [Pseudomonadota bacterium]
VFHAAGPGHGKAVVSSYMLANEVAAKRGIMLSFAASFLQGVTAISAITILLLFLRGTGIRTDNLAGYLEITSYFCVMLLGLYLLWRKVLRPGHSHDHAHNHDHDHSHSHHNHNDHHTHVGCNHLHAPDPSQLEGNKLELKEAWSAILAVGLRPCTGAIVVLTFAFLNGLYVGGIASTFAMSLGTGITVASLALMAVVAKNTALRVAGMQDRTATVHRVIEIGGAALVFLLGLVLFSAAITV